MTEALKPATALGQALEALRQIENITDTTRAPYIAHAAIPALEAAMQPGEGEVERRAKETDDATD